MTSHACLASPAGKLLFPGSADLHGSPRGANLDLLNPFFFFKFVYFERESTSMRGRGAEREWERETQVGSPPSAQSSELRVGLELTNCKIMTQGETKSWPFNSLSRPCAPSSFFSSCTELGTLLTLTHSVSTAICERESK